MTDFTEYITKECDRWDSIAYQLYGDANLYEKIISVNSAVKITPTLSAGIKLKIPVIEQEQKIKFTLPPWKS